MRQNRSKTNSLSPSLDTKVSSIMALLQWDDTEDNAQAGTQEANESARLDIALSTALVSFKGAEAASLLEMLPTEQRALVWNHLNDDVASEALLQVVEDAAVCIISHTSDARLDRLLSDMEPNELASISELLPIRAISAAKNRLSPNERRWLDATISYADNSIGRLMSAEYLLFEGHQTVKETATTIRLLPHLPNQSDKVFIVNDKNQLEGIVSLVQLLRNNEDETLANIMDVTPIYFQPEEDAEEAGLSFERDDLISAPVVDENRVVIGRLTVESIMDYIREKAEQAVLAKEGLDVDSDLFGPIWKSAKQRWMWLSVNLVTAFVASRFIGLFEDSIMQLVALATLMPIVASIGGNTGNQTVALLIRGLSLGQIRKENLRFLFLKELSISLINGLIWGSVLGAFAYALYDNVLLGVVLTVATMLNLLVAAFIGMVVPIGLDKLGKDPALGSSVILTFITDSMGFFIFLSLATIFLIP